jgi:hypothetical protein
MRISIGFSKTRSGIDAALRAATVKRTAISEARRHGRAQHAADGHHQRAEHGDGQADGAGPPGPASSNPSRTRSPLGKTFQAVSRSPAIAELSMG